MKDKAITEIPSTISELLIQIGDEWIRINAGKELLKPNVVQHWANLINLWQNDGDMPLVIRKSSYTRGSVVTHISNRQILFADNSPATWVAEQIYDEEMPTFKELKVIINEEKKLPVKFAFKNKGEEDAIYTQRSTNRINKAGWKLCHIKPVGIRKKVKIEEMDVTELKNHFNLFMNPNNFYLLPMVLGSLGEIDCFTQRVISKI